MYESALRASAGFPAAMATLNLAWQRLRQRLFAHNNNEQFERMRAQVGDETAYLLRDSGFIGITMGRNDDVKCLHAQVADELTRGQNPMGQMVMELLQARGVDPRGCDGKIVLKKKLLPIFFLINSLPLCQCISIFFFRMQASVWRAGTG